MTVDSVEIFRHFAFWRHETRLASFFMAPKRRRRRRKRRRKLQCPPVFKIGGAGKTAIVTIRRHAQSYTTYISSHNALLLYKQVTDIKNIKRSNYTPLRSFGSLFTFIHFPLHPCNPPPLCHSSVASFCCICLLHLSQSQSLSRLPQSLQVPLYPPSSFAL